MRQPFATENGEEKFLIIGNNSRIFACLKQMIIDLQNQGDAQICKRLLEAVGAALLRGESPENLIRRIGRKRSPKSIYFGPLTATEAEKDILEIKQLRKLTNAKPLVPGARKLERYHAEIKMLHTLKASYRDIQLWLFAKKKLVVSHHSVHRYLK